MRAFEFIVEGNSYEEPIDEGVLDTLKKGAAAGAIALSALGAGNVDAKTDHPVMKPGTYQKVEKTPAVKDTASYNVLSNNSDICFPNIAILLGRKIASNAPSQR
jgi:hypothetical protein